MPYEGDSFKLRGVVFSKVTKGKDITSPSSKIYEKVSSILPELIPIDISRGCTSSKISVPIPAQPALRMRMGFQGPTLHIIAYLHNYDAWVGVGDYNKLILTNWYYKWKWGVQMEDLIKVAAAGDTYADDFTGSIDDYGSPVSCDLDNVLFPSMPSGYSALLSIKPGTYWWVRKKQLTREAGWGDKYKMELDLERSWQWSTSGRQRPAYDVDVMECFKDGETGYKKLTTEYSSV